MKTEQMNQKLRFWVGLILIFDLLYHTPVHALPYVLALESSLPSAYSCLGDFRTPLQWRKEQSGPQYFSWATKQSTPLVALREARAQVHQVALGRRLDVRQEEQLLKAINARAYRVGIFSDPVVNVLEVNLALDLCY